MAGRDLSIGNISFNTINGSQSSNGNNRTHSSGLIFNSDSKVSLGKGVMLEGVNKEALLEFIQKAGLSFDNIRDAKFVTLDNGKIGISIVMKPEKGNTTTLTFDKDNGGLLEHSTQNKQGVITTTSYDDENVKSINIKQGDRTLTADNLSRILKSISDKGSFEYTYNDETVRPSRVLEQLTDGTRILHQGGQKVTTKPDGTTTTEVDNLTSKLQDILDDSKTKSTTAPKSLDSSLLSDFDFLKIKIPRRERSPKSIAKAIQRIFYASASSPNRSQKLQQALALINSSNVDWVIYEYKVLTNRDLFADVKIVFKNSPNTLKAYNRHFAQVQYGKYGVNMNFKNQHSVVSNKYHKGDPHSVVQDGTIITVTNKKTGKSRQIDLDVLLKKYPNARDRARVIKQLQSLPGEVLMDIAIETDSFIPAKEGEQVSVGGGMACNAAGYYSGSTDTIHLDSNGSTQTLVHEMGHAVDFNGRVNNTSSVLNDRNFKRLFNEEMRNFIAAGNQRYVYTPDGNGSGTRGSYATANEKEMFAECYTLLMTGNCGSKAVIERYFPRCLAYINNKIEQNRSLSDSYRH